MIDMDQVTLLDFLKQYPVAGQRACLTIQDAGKTGDWRQLSYRLRPLVRHKYIARRKDGLYSLLTKGEECTYTFFKPLISCGGNASARKRAAEIAGVAALFRYHNIVSFDKAVSGWGRCFIPSPIWRTIRQGLVSTTRFLGMLYFDGLRLVVYDIGDGTMQWQTYAECSLHFRDYGSYETRATGILMLCDDGLGVSIGKQIIQRTMWNRQRLIKDANDYSWENPKKRAASKSPIKLHSDYQRVYLAERHEVLEILKTAAAEQRIKDCLCRDLQLSESSDRWGRFLEQHPHRYYVNPQNDLLYLAVLFKRLKEYGQNASELRHQVIMRQEYADLARIYSDLDLKVLAIPKEQLQCLMN